MKNGKKEGCGLGNIIWFISLIGEDGGGLCRITIPTSHKANICIITVHGYVYNSSRQQNRSSRWGNLVDGYFILILSQHSSFLSLIQQFEGYIHR